MHYMKMLGLATVTATALAAIGTASASATTLEVNGVAQNKAVTIEAEATSGLVLAKTDGSEANTCSQSKLNGTTSVYTGSRVTGSLNELSFKTCKTESVVVDAPGGLYIEHEAATTSGNVFSENLKVTVPTSFGFKVTCETGTGTKIGTLTGSAAGHATLAVSAVLNCGLLLPSATWKGNYKLISPTGLGITSDSASPTTLEVNGVAQNKAVTIEAEATSGLVLAKTDGSEANTCSQSKLSGGTSIFTGFKVTGALSMLTFSKCKLESVVVDAAGQLYIEHEAATTSGNVFSENLKVTVPTSFGFKVTCETGTGTKIGTLTGSAAGHATLAISAVLSCGLLLPSATWKGNYKITSPTGLGVVA